MQVAVIHNHPIHYKHLLFQEMRKAELDFCVIFAAAASSVRHETIALHQTLYSFEFCTEDSYEKASALARLLKTWNALAKARPSFVVISGCHAAECWAAWLWAAVHEARMVLWYECNWFDFAHRPRWKEMLKKLFISRCERAHVYGLSNRDYLVKLGYPPGKIDLQRAVVDVDRFSTHSGRSYSSDGFRRAIFVGRLAEEKNLSLLLRALANANRLAHDYRWKLQVAGAGQLDKRLRRESQDLGIADCVDFLGYCPQAELPSRFRQADLFVLPSLREPWGLVALEAMLCRVPIAVSTQCGCAADLVNDETGWMFSPWNEDELTVLLLRVLGMPTKMLAAMGDAGYSLAMNYSAANGAKRVLHSLESAGLKREINQCSKSRGAAA